MHSKSSFRYAVLFAGALFLAKAIFLATASIRGLGITTWIIDDTFIIARVARNIALGFGFSYDFTHATTGAPPMWTYITALNHLIFPSVEWAMKATFIETTFFASLATLVVFKIAKKITDNNAAAWIAFILSSLTANAFLQAMNGMDTSLFTLGIVMAVAMYLGIGRPKNWSDGWWAAAIGFVAGFTSLVRGDGIFMIGTIGLLELIAIAKLTGDARTKRFKLLVIFTAVAALCFASLIGWQMARTGTPFLGNQIGRRELAMSLHGFDFNHFVFSKYIKIVGWNVFQLEKLIAIATGGTFLAVLALAAGGLRKERNKLASVTTIYIVTFFGALCAYQWYFPDLHGLRYVNPAVHLLFVLVAALLVDLPLGKLKSALIGFFVTGLIILSHYSFYDMATHLQWAPGFTFTAHPTTAEEKDAWALIDWVRENLPEDAVIGVRDHGRFALFSDRPIQDVAGNIDPTVPLLARTSGLKEYLQKQGLDYLVIPSLDVRQDLIYKVLHTDLKLEQVPGAPEFRRSKLYKVVW